MIYIEFKKIIDKIFAFLILVIFLPFITISATIIKLSSKGPILFKQTRIGFKEKKFTIFKFRTMHLNNLRKIEQSYNNSRDVYNFGSIMRRTKFDELAQLINVLKGEMSFIGPRPCLHETLLEMPKWSKKRFTVLPGMTGLAQVKGNINLCWEKRWEYDCLYIEKMSFWIDVYILIKTLKVIIFGEKN